MTAGPIWTRGLEAWYEANGRHHLPWRRTRDPWAVLVSEVMLQQTSVARVLPRWERFLERWPTPAACAAAPLDDVLREWDGLGYPRRARSLRAAAAAVADAGWPRDERGLCRLPGIGPYTARALLAFAFDAEATAPPRDVNLGRVAARAGLGVEVEAVPPSAIAPVLAGGHPATMTMREYAFALFDLGATVCRARHAACAACPLTDCRSRSRLEATAGRPARRQRRQPPYAGSMRQLRGEVLREMLSDRPPRSFDDLARRVAHVAAAGRAGAVEEAVAALRDDGLLPHPVALEVAGAMGRRA